MSRKHNVLALLLIASLSGCSNAPSIPVLGAYFPDCLFCILAGMLLAFLLQVLLARLGFATWLAPSVLTYPVLTALLSMSTWLLFFQN
ncbi:YtcA family lipoprotein [Pseudomonas sp. BIC9C]|uniref:YtcA family lipoprotein n=1 Tax=Pseudomonas sp. BIC9C TaxID=3078458 RepID=UPI002AD50D93|nr:YtcA family lipoprotein [Pseudomonas sp. BIC9C]